jgi:ubiquitin-conjugating enzyme E2 G1
MSEKWRPILGVESILVSVQSMLSEPNFSSPANIDASVEWQKSPEDYRKRIRALVRRTLEEL